MKQPEKARVDIRLSGEQKTLVEQAVNLGGFKTTTEFVLYAVKMEADRIIDKHASILSSRKDQELFFDAILNPPVPNERLRKAVKKHVKVISK